MLKIDTYIKDGDSFIQIENLKLFSGDPDYIEGALVLELNNCKLLGVDEWDYVDQLWAYVIDGVCDIASGNSFSCYFPDQPIKLCFDIEENKKIKITVSIRESKSELISYEEFITSFRTKGLAFIDCMEKLLPSSAESLHEYRIKLLNIKLSP